MGTHPNIHLQSAFNLYGEEKFKWNIIEYLENISYSRLIEREDYWIDFFKSIDRKYGYNLRTANRNKSYTGTGKIIKGENNHRSTEYDIIDIFSMQRHKGKGAAEFARRMSIKGAEGLFLLRNGKINIWNNRFVTDDSLTRVKFYRFRNIISGQCVQHFSPQSIAKLLETNTSNLHKIIGGIKKSWRGWISESPSIETAYIIGFSHHN